MAQREKQAVKRSAAHGPEAPSGAAKTGAKSPAASRTAGRGEASSEATRMLEQERDELKAALDIAVARIAALEESQSQVTNRIGWMIDTLRTLKDDAR
jgi:hypothetical protein